MSGASIPGTIDPLAKPLHSWQTCANDLGSHFVTARLLDGRPDDLEGGLSAWLNCLCARHDRRQSLGLQRLELLRNASLAVVQGHIVPQRASFSMRRGIVKSAASKLVSSCVQITCPSECAFCFGQCHVLTGIQWLRVRFMNVFIGEGSIAFVVVLCVVCTVRYRPYTAEQC